MVHHHQNQRHFDKSLDSHQFYGADKGLQRYPQNIRAAPHAPTSKSLPPIEQEYRPIPGWIVIRDMLRYEGKRANVFMLPFTLY